MAIQSFKDLDAWKEAHQVVLLIYRVTKLFPKDELFGLVSQMRRAVVSITSNIAEGFCRQSYKEKVQFYSIALGSVSELQNQIQIVFDIQYISKDAFSDLDTRLLKVHKIINGLIRSSRERLRPIIPTS